MIAIAIALGITVHEIFFLMALLIAVIACIEWGAHEVHVIHELHEHKTHRRRVRTTNRFQWKRRDEGVFVRFKNDVLPSIVSICIVAASLTTASATDRHVGRLPPGDFFWEPELAPSGPVVMIISLPDQTLSAYRNGIRIAYSSISSGVKGRSTPAGVFTILEKEISHFSNKCHHAPMPYVQRLTWEGVALHGGDLPGYPASHGCIRLPREFAKRLYSVTTRGTTVIVVDEKHPQPTIATHAGILLANADSESDISRPIETEFEWNPERSAQGPITILASGADETVYVYRNGISIGRAGFKIDNPQQPLGGHAFTMLEGVAETPSAFVPVRPAHRWMAVRTQGKTTLEDIGERVHISPEFAEKVYDIVSPGATVVVTDAPALRPSPSAHAIS